MTSKKEFSFYEFFAGGGMVRAGLGENWQCLFANDFDEMKAAAYKKNWGAADLKIDDVANVSADDLPSRADLSWASFPCQDLSLAGSGAGIHARRSGSFWPYWSIMKALAAKGRAPAIIALENVYGALRSHSGKDFAAIGAAFAEIGYQFGAIVVDAAHFLPQSRQRLFIIGVRPDIAIPENLRQRGPQQPWHPRALTDAYAVLSKQAMDAWVWWSLPEPEGRRLGFSDLIEDEPVGVRWNSRVETQRLLNMMTETNILKVRAAQALNRRVVAGVYKRTRDGIQRAEVRTDDIAGCLRTPAGGSSRQTILVINGESIRSRLLSPREAARLMGLPDSYDLPDRYNDAYHLAGDGVAVPVVRSLAETIFEPVLRSFKAGRAAA